MEAREKEVLRAAHVLRDYCRSHEHSCGGCLLNDMGSCNKMPQDWYNLPKLEDAPKEDEPKEEKTLQIMTIRRQLDYAEYFDEDVNKALADGWHLVKRYTLPAYAENKHIMLIAELQRYDNG